MPTFRRGPPRCSNPAGGQDRLSDFHHLAPISPAYGGANAPCRLHQRDRQPPRTRPSPAAADRLGISALNETRLRHISLPAHTQFEAGVSTVRPPPAVGHLPACLNGAAGLRCSSRTRFSRPTRRSRARPRRRSARDAITAAHRVHPGCSTSTSTGRGQGQPTSPRAFVTSISALRTPPRSTATARSAARATCSCSG